MHHPPLPALTPSIPPVIWERLPGRRGDGLLEAVTGGEVPGLCPASPCWLVRISDKAHV